MPRRCSRRGSARARTSSARTPRECRSRRRFAPARARPDERNRPPQRVLCPVDRSLHREPLVQPVDQVGHLLEPVGDHAEAVLAKVLRLDAERRREAGDDFLRRHRPVAVHEVVEVAGGEAGLRGETPVREARLPHQALDRAPEVLLAVLPFASHQQATTRFAISKLATRDSAPFRRSVTSTAPSSSVFFPTVTRRGHPIRSASANFSPGRSRRSSSRTSSPSADSAAAICSPVSTSSALSQPRTTTSTSYGAISLGQTISFSLPCCSTAAASTRPGPIPYEPITISFSTPSSSRYLTPNASEYLVPSLKMWPTSIAVWKRSAPPQTEQASPCFGWRRSTNSGS